MSLIESKTMNNFIMKRVVSPEAQTRTNETKITVLLQKIK